jgi:hypothetical protein
MLTKRKWLWTIWFIFINKTVLAFFAINQHVSQKKLPHSEKNNKIKIDDNSALYAPDPEISSVCAEIRECFPSNEAKGNPHFISLRTVYYENQTSMKNNTSSPASPKILFTVLAQNANLSIQVVSPVTVSSMNIKEIMRPSAIIVTTIL